MNDIIKEAEEDLQKERLLNFWETYKFLIIGALAALVIGTGAISFYQDWSMKRDRKATAEIRASLIGLDPVSLNALEELDAKLPKKHRAVADFLAGTKAIGVDDKAIASDNLQAVIDNKAADPLLRDLARINLAALQISQPEATLEQVEETLLPIIKNRKNAFYNEALIYFAVAQANLGKDYEQALASLDKIKAEDTASNLTLQMADTLSLVYKNKLEGNAS